MAGLTLLSGGRIHDESRRRHQSNHLRHWTTVTHHELTGLVIVRWSHQLIAASRPTCSHSPHAHYYYQQYYHCSD